ncbi:class I SAM-dependent methyltransferase, partial [Streptomyces brasiliscabiei]|uniref:class I SAM-dependent methyltransferase n=1 Tax=Streptomyces brasiliscabiei TaxID=2736302 RepID=UPI0038F75915
VTGVDIAANLIERARSRAQAENLQARFEEADAEALPFEDESFDVVGSLIGAMFAPQPEAVARELVRVCKPGGTIAMANWTPQ